MIDSRSGTVTLQRPRAAAYMVMPEAALSLTDLRLLGAAACRLAAPQEMAVETFDHIERSAGDVRAINPRDYGVLWRGLGAPDKLAFTMNLMMRYVPTLSRDFAQTMDAQRARGLELDKPKGGFAERVRRFAPLVIPVIVRSVVDSTDVADAMEMRSFGAVRRRSWIRALRYRARDLILIGIGSLGLALAAALSLGWIALPAV
jgi:energy-coupling factor transport system permease protein